MRIALDERDEGEVGRQVQQQQQQQYGYEMFTNVQHTEVDFGHWCVGG